MSLSIQQVIQLIEELAPKKLAADWDQVGLQIGDYQQRVSKVLVTLDVNTEIMEEAINKEVDLIVSHHPVIFDAISTIRLDTELGQIIKKAITNQISIYVAHTNYDIAKGGLNDTLAVQLGLEEVEVLQKTAEDELKKLVVFVPAENLTEVREAITAQGAGCIGDYSDCTFQVEGEGSFRPLAGSDPYLGEQGELAKVKECRLESIVPASKLGRVINELKAAHPYEEVAYDLYSLEIAGEKLGLGRIGYLENELAFEDYLEQVKELLEVNNLRVVPPTTNTINKVAVCGGAGGDLIKQAAFKGADLLLTGDLKYHEAELAVELGLGVIAAGHYATEVIMQSAMVDYLQEQLSKKSLTEITVCSSERNKDFIEIV
ncbi:Nif3-like dinuclear metal center hexameric protein [Fuchsiella alkaliacetigena]|uniref:Nif3-like dinuclear metal center hexameric protein n=1 Tax=Fuchsiella alkaliacetigena TaxID=957042 RepID=UPI00200A9F23|nr:Nif3-like dinuclear metal center hexameric protein [Fuchsiella alkaliacetigena]MCK8824487.1 Nif3-like dinuclear metal center hexameric protein [Fuchsiella alkaliacetigena]